MKKLVFFLLLVLIVSGLNSKIIIPDRLSKSNNNTMNFLRDVNPPNDLSINISAVLKWTVVPNASNYIVEASNESTTGFTDVTSSGLFTYNANSVYWFTLASQHYQFFRIISVEGVATPTFSLADGTYSSAQTVEISCATSGAQIRYTTNGSEPTESSLQYNGAITISSTTILKAKAFKTGIEASITATALYTIIPIPANFVLVQGGTFNNGTSNVTISSFYLDKYELTQSAYQAVMGTNPSYFTGVTNRPVEQVSWFNAIEYCNKRSISEGLTPCYSYSTNGVNPATWPSGWNTNYLNHTNVSCSWTANGYRLPTEAEWQFAARGGNSTHNYTYSGSNTIDGIAWYESNSSSTTHTVGTKTANELGLFDMSGNIWEWNWDIYGTYPSGAQVNPHGAVSGFYRVQRGGSWSSGASGCPVSNRYLYSYATYSDYNIGFRLCRIVP